MTNIELVAPIQQLKLSACLLIFCVEQLQSWTGLRWVLARSLYSHQFGKTLSLSLDLPILLMLCSQQQQQTLVLLFGEVSDCSGGLRIALPSQ